MNMQRFLIWNYRGGSVRLVLWTILILISISERSTGLNRPKDLNNNNRKSYGFSRKEENKATALNGISLHTDFPYRFVFPANHPYSNYGQYPAIYSNQNNYEEYAPSPSPPTSQQQKFEILLKQQMLQYPSNVAVMPQNMFPSPSQYQIPQNGLYSAPTSPMVFMFQPNQVSPNGGNPQFQTFVLVPSAADNGNQVPPIAGGHSPSLGIGHPFGNGLRFQSNSPSGVTIPQIPAGGAVMPINVGHFSPQVLPPSNPFIKMPANQLLYQNQVSSPILQQRPFYQIVPKQYFPQKKSFFETKLKKNNNNNNYERHEGKSIIQIENPKVLSTAEKLSNMSESNSTRN